ncbi:kinase-like domain-containing protein [Xylariaceae sp. FL0255]|nr:kinase-like domain-containing protein [Xylariaceae sp. FL0255]
MEAKPTAEEESPIFSSAVDRCEPNDTLRCVIGDHPVINSIHDLQSLYEVFDERDGALVLVDCSFLTRNSEGIVYFGSSTRNKLDLRPADFSKAVTRVPDHEIYPEPLPSTTVYNGDVETSHHTKNTRLPDYEGFAGIDYLAKLLLPTQHPNLVRPICCTLMERVEQGEYGPYDIESYLSAIQCGIMHLHSLGLAHNDLNPNNIMLNDYDIPIIIDFGSCRPFGQRLLTSGTVGWIDADYTSISDRPHDESAIRRIKAWLEKHMSAIDSSSASPTRKLTEDAA